MPLGASLVLKMKSASQQIESHLSDGFQAKEK